MSRCKVRTLRGLLYEANFLLDIVSKENRDLRRENRMLNKQVIELTSSCENFVEVEQNLHRKIEKLSKKPMRIRQKVFKFFS